MYYTYAYLREDRTPYYVGKGSGKRIHNPAGKCVSLPRLERRIYLKTNLTEEDALKHEVYMIAVLGRKDLGEGILHNRTDGGDTGGRQIRSPEVVEKWRKRFQGQRWKMKPVGVENIREAACKYLYKLVDESGNNHYTNNIKKFARDNNIHHYPLYQLLHNRFVNKKGNYKGWVNVEIVGSSSRAKRW